MDFWIAPSFVFNGTALTAGQAVRVQDGHITDLSDTVPEGAVRIDGILSPGFVDLQVNGGGGDMMNNTPTRKGVETIVTAHQALGTAAVLPTVITDQDGVMARAAEAVIASKDINGMLGLHIEGPHIDHIRRGTHRGAFVRPMEQQTIDIVRRVRSEGLAVMITVSPSGAGIAAIRELSALGAVVSIGHSDATAAETKAAIAAGATCGTHLFNAMSPMTSREPGTVGAIINSDCYSGIICDGHHVADDMIAMAIRARPRSDRMFLVSDAMSTVGGPDHFKLYDATIRLEDGRLVNDEGSLAGAHVTQAQGVKRLVDHVGISVEQALCMGLSNPAACIGRPDLTELVGRRAQDVILLASDLSFRGAVSDVMSAHFDAAE